MRECLSIHLGQAGVQTGMLLSSSIYMCVLISFITIIIAIITIIVIVNTITIIITINQCSIFLLIYMLCYRLLPIYLVLYIYYIYN